MTGALWVARLWSKTKEPTGAFVYLSSSEVLVMYVLAWLALYRNYWRERGTGLEARPGGRVLSLLTPGGGVFISFTGHDIFLLVGVCVSRPVRTCRRFSHLFFFFYPFYIYSPLLLNSLVRSSNSTVVV